MSKGGITAGQMKKLQTLWGQLAHAQGIDGGDRAERIAWMSDRLGRRIESYKEMTKDEAIRRIDEIERLLGKPRASERQAWAYGNEGKRTRLQSIAITVIDAATLRQIEKLCMDVGWTREQLDAFVRGPKGPGRLDTIGQGNRVIWVLRRILRERRKGAAAKNSVPTEASAA